MSSVTMFDQATLQHVVFEDTKRNTIKLGSTDPISIVGMSCRFAGDTRSPSKLWDAMTTGQDSWSPIAEHCFDAKSLYHPDQQKTDRHHVKGGYFIGEDVNRFDAQFFSMSTEAASAMDPQLRLLMEHVYEALEDAGIPLEMISGSNTSVFSAAFGRDYTDRLMKDPEAFPSSFITGNEPTMLSNRISHFFNLKGPSVTVHTGCSGSMTALHLGVQSLMSGESDTSIIGAANCLLNPDFFIALSNLGVLSPEGRCYSWDDRADGYGRGEGVAVIVLKRLSSALQDGDRIHAVIRGTATNQDGRTGTITTPSTIAQQTLIEDCYRRADLEPSDTGYIEAHMTGTAAGDPIEAAAIANVFGKSRSPGRPVYVGSIKPNIGHTESVSGLASIIKTALILQRQAIPANLNYITTNPDIPLKRWNLHVPTTLTPWPQGMPLRASVNNFGYGGSNVHVILEAAPQVKAHVIGGHVESDVSNDRVVAEHTNGITGERPVNLTRSSSYVYITSSKDATGLLSMDKNLAGYIRDCTPEASNQLLADLAYTLGSRRSRFPWVTAVRARSLEDLAAKLQNTTRAVARATMQPRIGFVFNGQGAQWYAMGRELIYTYPTFESAIRNSDKILRDDYGASWSLYDELMRDKMTSRVHDVEISQPLSVAVQLCLVDLLRSWNVIASAVVSHSSGEIPAAYAAGVLTFREALGVVYHRGRLAAEHQGLTSLSGGMLAARLSPEDAGDYLKDLTSGKVVVACINSPISVTLSGDDDALYEVEEKLKDDGIFARRLKVPLAYHSHHMQHMASEYEECLQEVLGTTKRTPNICFASPVTGGIITSNIAFGPSHWVRNLTSTVLFSDALERMVFCTSSPVGPTRPTNTPTEVDVLLELGAHETLSGPIRQVLGTTKIPYVSCLRRSINAVDTMQDVVCELLTRGYPVSLCAVNFPRSTDVKYVHDLPKYIWNHRSAYEIEPRASRQHRYKQFSPHELLGTPTYTTSLTKTWRNFLRTQDIPWLEDHQIDSKAVLPGAGYISMAIEAVRLLRSPSIPEERTVGYRLRDVTFMNALVIPSSTSGLEISFSLRPCSERELDYRDWWEFELLSVDNGDSWTQHCHGFVQAAETYVLASEVEPSRSSTKSFLASRNDSIGHVEPEVVFSTLRRMDFYHGPMFQNLVGSQKAGSRSVTEFHLSPVILEGQDRYVVHPTTLDSVFQSCYVCLPSEATDTAMLLPRSIGDLFISSKIEECKNKNLLAFVDLREWSARDASFRSTVAGDDVTTESCLRLNDFHLQRISQVQDQDEGTDARSAGIHAKARWELDVLHDIPHEIKRTLEIALDSADLAFERQIRTLASRLIGMAVSQLQHDERDSWQWYHKKFHAWMKGIAKSGQRLGHAEDRVELSVTREMSTQSLIDNLQSANAVGELLCRVGTQLASIVRGKITPLELMMEHGLLHRYYQELPHLKNRSLKHLAYIMNLYSTKEPGARVLEIGGGTGGATATVLQAFDANAGGKHGSSLRIYDFTDISPGFFEAAKEKFAAWEGVMRYSKLNIENDPLQQGFVAESYDLIVAAQVLHATTNIEKTLKNVRSLLKPGGKLVMVESTQDSLDTQLVFGTLPGWWLSEEQQRHSSPNMSLTTWDESLRATGFSGIDFEMGDCVQSEYQVSSLIMATKEPESSYPETVTIVYEETTQIAWLNRFVKGIANKTGVTPTISHLNDVQAEADRVYIIAVNELSPFVEKVREKAYEKVHNLLTHSLGVLWLSRSDATNSEVPLAAQAEGLLRTLRREDSGKRYVHLDIDSLSWTEASIKHAVHVYEQTFNFEDSKAAAKEWEYAVKDSLLYVRRIYPDSPQNKIYNGARPSPELQTFQKAGRDLVWEVSEGSALENLFFKEQRSMSADIPDGIVEIVPKVFGLNFQDVLTAMGMLKPTSFVAHEASGIVKRLGPGTEKSGLRVGDRVCGVFQGRFATTSRALWTNVVKVPAKMSLEEAASIPYAYGTSYIGLFHVARLQKGETVLIHSAAGGVGQAAIMLAQSVGATVYATCGSESKRRMLVERYNLPPHHVMSSRHSAFATAVMAHTEGKGVDVVLNSLAGPLLKATWECMARFGRFVEIGKIDVQAAKRLDMSPFSRNVAMTCIDLIQYCFCKGAVVQEALVASIDLSMRGKVSFVHPITSYRISQMEKAMKFMQTGHHTGKLVLLAQEDEEVSVLPQSPQLSLDDHDSTYMIVGGLSGIGHATALWMMRNGARNLLLVSRNAESHKNVSSLLEKAKRYRCHLKVYSCDVSDKESLAKLLVDLKKEMPAIKGVVQAAMILDDSVFERMSYDQWLRAIRPKVFGSLNLHRLLPDLRFFVMLSSAAGVLGSVSQANYAAGNTFQDALARHRTMIGMPAVSINLGQVEDAGYVAERAELRQNFDSAFGSVTLSLDHVMQLIEGAIRQPLRSHPDDSQIITCIQNDGRVQIEALLTDKRFGALNLVSASAIQPKDKSHKANRLSELTQNLKTAGPTQQNTVELLCELLAEKIGEIFDVDPSGIETSLPLPQHGVDSLVAVQFRNWINSVLKAKVSIFEVLQSPSLASFSALVATRSGLVTTVN